TARYVMLGATGLVVPEHRAGNAGKPEKFGGFARRRITDGRFHSQHLGPCGRSIRSHDPARRRRNGEEEDQEAGGQKEASQKETSREEEASQKEEAGRETIAVGQQGDGEEEAGGQKESRTQTGPGCPGCPDPHPDAGPRSELPRAAGT